MKSIDSLPIGWIIGSIIYFTGKVSGSSPTLKNYRVNPWGIIVALALLYSR
jgi:hypothetical protein